MTNPVEAPVASTPVSARGLARHWLVYGLGPASSRLVGFLMLPVYTTYLSPEEFGIKAMVVATGNIVMLFMALGIQAAVLRFYWGDDGRPRPEVVSTGLVASIVLASLCMALAFGLSEPIARLAFGRAGYGIYVRLGLVAMSFAFVQDIPLTYLQLQKRSGLYTGIAVARLCLGVVLNVTFIVVLDLGILGLLYADVILAVVFAGVLTAATFRRIGWRVSTGALGQMIRYGAPSLGVTAGWLAIDTVDRLLLTRLGSLSDVGIYSLASQIASILLAMVIEPFRRVWGPQQFEIYRQKDAAAVFPRVFRLFVSILLVFAFLLSVFAEDVLRIMATPAFLGAAGVVPLLVFSQMMMGVHLIFSTGMLIEKRTVLMAGLVLLAAAANVWLNFLLVPPLLAAGAGLARGLSVMLLAVMTAWAASRVYPIPFRPAETLPAVGFAFCLFWLTRWIPSESLALSIGLKSLSSIVLALGVVRLFLGDRLKPARWRDLTENLLSR